MITSSVVGLTSAAGICAYATAKHALVGLMRTLAKETAPHGIRVNTIHPGPVDNEFQHRIEVAATGASSAQAAAAFEELIPPAGTRRRPRWPAPCCSWPATRARSSPAPRSPSTAACPSELPDAQSSWMPKAPGCLKLPGFGEFPDC